MYVPIRPEQSAPALAPVAVVSSGPPTLTRAAATTLKLRDAQLNVLDGHRASVAGTLIPGLAGRVVAIQALGKHGWSTIARTHTGPRGSFELNLVPRQIGSERVRLRFAGDALAVAAGLQLGNLNVYRLAEASWYGGGGEMACGGSLTSSTLGVASKTLPCGTLVTFRYGGRSVRVPVVDRGPYVAGREFDLTEAVKQALGFGETGEVWSTS